MIISFLRVLHGFILYRNFGLLALSTASNDNNNLFDENQMFCVYARVRRSHVSLIAGHFLYGK